MNNTVKGYELNWSGSEHKVVSTDVRLGASLSAGVWLVDGDDLDDLDHSFLMIVGAPTTEDAARAYARYYKGLGVAPPNIFRVFPLVSLEPIALGGVIDKHGHEDWSAFQSAWIEVRL